MILLDCNWAAATTAPRPYTTLSLVRANFTRALLLGATRRQMIDIDSIRDFIATLKLNHVLVLYFTGQMRISVLLVSLRPQYSVRVRNHKCN